MTIMGMKSIVLFLLLATILVLGCSENQSGSPTDSDISAVDQNYTEIEWVNSAYIFDNPDMKALSFLYFTDDTCNFGRLLEESTFVDQQVMNTINNYYNPLYLSTESDSLMPFLDMTMTGNEIFKQYNLVGVPSILILNEHYQNVGRIRGYIPPDSFLVLLNNYIQ